MRVEISLLSCPCHFTSFSNLLQDDFLDLGDDNSSHHHAEMALCLSPNSATTVPTVSVTNLPKSNQIPTEAEADLQNVNQLVNDNPVMKLDNLDSWDQDV